MTDWSSPDADPVGDILDAMRRAVEQDRWLRENPCGSELRPHVVHPRLPDGPCLVCGAVRMP